MSRHVKLLVCSNSSPRWQDGVGLLPRSPGGLVPLLASLLDAYGGQWISTAPTGTPAGTTDPVDGIRLHRLAFPPPVLEQYYERIGTRLLLWLFHYLLDPGREPPFDGTLPAAWAGYEAVNQAYADTLARVATNSPDEVILLNDHHLFLVPEMYVRTGRSPGRLVFFHGLPWCEPEYFGILPGRLRERILASLLRCDVVGFHSGRWADSFVACCARYLPGCQVSDRRLAYAGHRTRVVVAPFPLDVTTVERLRHEPATDRWRSELAALAAGRRVVARAERLDLWKNHPRGFAAYRAILEREPELAARWWFCAVVTPPTRPTERSRAYWDLCEAMVADLNDRYGRPDRPAVSLVYPASASTRNCVVATLSEAAVTLVNPTFDGMNLVAKEALYLAERAPLLLSVNAGAYPRLAGHVIPVDPFDVEATSSVLRAAMAGEPGPAPDAARELLRRGDAAGWLAEMIDF